MNNGRLHFFKLVRDMRAAQKEYFQSRTHAALMRSMQLERKVDEQLKRGDAYLKEKQQPSLFPEGETV